MNSTWLPVQIFEWGYKKLKWLILINFHFCISARSYWKKWLEKYQTFSNYPHTCDLYYIARKLDNFGSWGMHKQNSLDKVTSVLLYVETTLTGKWLILVESFLLTLVPGTRKCFLQWTYCHYDTSVTQISYTIQVNSLSPHIDDLFFREIILTFRGCSSVTLHNEDI